MDSIPTEILLEIFSWLCIRDKLKTRRISKCYQCIIDNKIFIKRDNESLEDCVERIAIEKKLDDDCLPCSTLLYVKSRNQGYSLSRSFGPTVCEVFHGYMYRFNSLQALEDGMFDFAKSYYHLMHKFMKAVLGDQSIKIKVANDSPNIYIGWEKLKTYDGKGPTLKVKGFVLRHLYEKDRINFDSFVNSLLTKEISLLPGDCDIFDSAILILRIIGDQDERINEWISPVHRKFLYWYKLIHSRLLIDEEVNQIDLKDLTLALVDMSDCTPNKYILDNCIKLVDRGKADPLILNKALLKCPTRFNEKRIENFIKNREFKTCTDYKLF